VVDAQVDESRVVQQVVYAIGAGDAVGEAFEIIHVDRLVLALWLPLFAVIFEIADEFFFRYSSAP
jgi:hypothetical protein